MGRLHELGGEQKGWGGRRAEMSWSYGMDGEMENMMISAGW